MNVKELSAISSTLGPIIREAVAREVTAHVKAVVPAVGPQGAPGERGADGKDGEMGPQGPAGRDAEVDLDALALKTAELIRVPTDGKDGRDGKDADADAIAVAVLEKVMPAVSAAVEKAVADRLTAAVQDSVTKAFDAMPKPKDGKDGRDGVDGAKGEKGEPGASAVLPDLQEFAKSVAALVPAGKDGKDGINGRDGLPGVQGEKGLDGRDGLDGLGFDDMTVEHDGERAFTIKAKRGDRVKTIGAVNLPVQINRGVYQDGKTYERGDVVTWGGSQWHANETTNSKPGDGSKAWTLTVKRGRDGKDGGGVVPPAMPVVSIKR